jgi:hypothetical protein
LACLALCCVALHTEDVLRTALGRDQPSVAHDYDRRADLQPVGIPVCRSITML